MIKFISPEDLIYSDEFVRQPVNEASRFLSNHEAKKIIIGGQRSSGKTVVLYNHQFKTVGTDNPAMFTRFDSVGLFGDNRVGQKDSFDDEFVIHYYELIMANKILNFIAYNYEKVFKEHFAGDKEKIKKLLNEVDNFIRDCCYKDITLRRKYLTHKLTKDYIERFKNDARLNSLTLMIDRFDWTDGHSAIAQTVLKEYFNLFDKAIITTDDEQLIGDEQAITSLAQSGFDYMETNYGKDMDIVKELVSLKVKKYNSNVPEGDKLFPVKEIPDEVWKRLLEKANGNISVILHAVNDMNGLWQFKDCAKKEFDFMENMEYGANRKLAEVKELKRMSRPIRLYLTK